MAAILQRTFSIPFWEWTMLFRLESFYSQYMSQVSIYHNRLSQYVSGIDVPQSASSEIVLSSVRHRHPSITTMVLWILSNSFPFHILWLSDDLWHHRSGPPWAYCQIRKIAGCACAGNAGNISPRRRLQRKLLVSDPGMHHGTCVTHVPWCMSGSLTRHGGENVPGIPSACAPAILRIW